MDVQVHDACGSRTVYFSFLMGVSPQAYASCLLFWCKSELIIMNSECESPCMCFLLRWDTALMTSLSCGQMESEDLQLLREAVGAFFETALNPQVGFPFLHGMLSGNYNKPFNQL